MTSDTNLQQPRSQAAPRGARSWLEAEESLQQAWLDTRVKVLRAIDDIVGAGKPTPDSTKLVLGLAEAYAWLTRPDQAHDRPATA